MLLAAPLPRRLAAPVGGVDRPGTPSPPAVAPRRRRRGPPPPATEPPADCVCCRSRARRCRTTSRGRSRWATCRCSTSTARPSSARSSTSTRPPPPCAGARCRQVRRARPAAHPYPQLAHRPFAHLLQVRLRDAAGGDADRQLHDQPPRLLVPRLRPQPAAAAAAAAAPLLECKEVPVPCCEAMMPTAVLRTRPTDGWPNARSARTLPRDGARGRLGRGGVSRLDAATLPSSFCVAAAFELDRRLRRRRRERSARTRLGHGTSRDGGALQVLALVAGGDCKAVRETAASQRPVPATRRSR